MVKEINIQGHYRENHTLTPSIVLKLVKKVIIYILFIFIIVKVKSKTKANVKFLFN